MKTKIPLQLTALGLVIGLSTQTFSKSKNNNMKETTKEKIGLLVTMKAKLGKEQEVKDFLIGGLALVNQELQTESWFAFQIDDRTFGIFDTFENEKGRQAHLSGEVAKALLANADSLLEHFEVTTNIQPFNLLASKLINGEEHKGLLVIMKSKEGKSADVENFLLAGKEMVNDEPKTISWYAIQLDDNTFAIFDTFANDKGRNEHLNGQVAAALMENAPTILEGFETTAIQKIDVLASK
ncbi:putative quinol monooxygenase [Aquimarina sp. AU474]|uniref:putative quinol monooxygenase n=1 Tax=Aquimarina sp. AU474 TaxID=2108529 RepID=UPI000D68783A|nr:hypothetical protein [Aquimarina sp. AU474]